MPPPRQRYTRGEARGWPPRSQSLFGGWLRQRFPPGSKGIFCGESRNFTANITNMLNYKKLKIFSFTKIIKIKRTKNY